MTGGVRFGVCAKEEREVVELPEVMETRGLLRVGRGLLEARHPDARRAAPPTSLQLPIPLQPPLPPPRTERAPIRRPTKSSRLRQSSHTRPV